MPKIVSFVRFRCDNTRGYIHQVHHGPTRLHTEAIGLQVFVWNDKKKKKKDLLQTIWLKKDTQLKVMGTTVESNTVMGDVLVICELHPK